MKKLISILGFIFIVGIVACGGDEIFDADAQLATDIALIEGFLDHNHLQADTLLPSEIRLIIHNEGVGEKGVLGTAVKTYYRGYFLNGQTFDSTAVDSTGTKAPPLGFIIDKGNVVKGWDIAFKELRSGSVATIYLPSSQGYGNQRNGSIPANSVLVFDVEVVEMR